MPSKSQRDPNFAVTGMNDSIVIRYVFWVRVRNEIIPHEVIPFNIDTNILDYWRTVHDSNRSCCRSPLRAIGNTDNQVLLGMKKNETSCFEPSASTWFNTVYRTLYFSLLVAVSRFVTYRTR